MTETNLMRMNGNDLINKLFPMRERMRDEFERKLVMERCKNLEMMLPRLTPWEEVMKKYPFCYEEPMNTMLIQEVRRYQ